MIKFTKSKSTPCGYYSLSGNIEDTSLTSQYSRKLITAKESSHGWIIETPDAIYEAEKNCNVEKIAGRIFEAPNYIKDLYADSNCSFFLYFPLSLELDITRKCNFKCIHCNRSSTSKASEELSLDTLEKIAQQCGEMGIRQVQILGGEPYIHSEFSTICQFFQNAGADKMFTSSNGWFVDENNIDLYKQYFQTVQISLHSLNPTKHDYITTKHHAWEKACNAIALLGEANINTVISMSVMHENIEEMEQMVDFAETSGVSAVRFLALQRVGRGKSLSGLNSNDLIKAGEIINVLQSKHKNIRILSSGFPEISEYRNKSCFYGCAAGKTLLAIKASGDVSCCSIVEQSCGNVHKDLIFNIWHNEHFRNTRIFHNSNCPFASRCGGKCKSNRTDAYSSYCF